MSYGWTDGDRYCAEFRFQEMRDRAARERLARSARVNRTLRQRVGGALIVTGQRLSR